MTRLHVVYYGALVIIYPHITDYILHITYNRLHNLIIHVVVEFTKAHYNYNR